MGYVRLNGSYNIFKSINFQVAGIPSLCKEKNMNVKSMSLLVKFYELCESLTLKIMKSCFFFSLSRVSIEEPNFAFIFIYIAFLNQISIFIVQFLYINLASIFFGGWIVGFSFLNVWIFNFRTICDREYKDIQSNNHFYLSRSP